MDMLLDEKEDKSLEKMREVLKIQEDTIENLKQTIVTQKEIIEDLENIRRDYGDYIIRMDDRINKILNSRSWKYTEFIRKYKKKKERKKSILNKIDHKPSILFIVHSWINIYDPEATGCGGTTLHLLDIVNHIKNDVNCYVLTIINGRYTLIKFEKDKQQIYDLACKAVIKNFDSYDYHFMSVLFELIKNLKIDLVHIHHLLSFPCDLQFLPPKIKTIITLHDYYAICPKIQLFNNKENLCINGNRSDCKQCMKHCNIDFNIRNEAIKNMLEKADLVIAPDGSVFEQIDYYITIKNKKVIPHGMNSNLIDYIPQKNRSLKNKNIAFLGQISVHKGLKIIKELVKNNDREDITYHLFGMSSDPYLNVDHSNYKYHGPYKQSNLIKLLIENEIDLVILPAIWPETFSYTLSETILAQVPCVSYNLGAIANRIKKDNIGFVIDKKKDFQYTDFIEMYDKIFDKNTYSKIVKNIKNYKHKTIDDMINETKECYKMPQYKTKNYDEINDYLERYLLKYII